MTIPKPVVGAWYQTPEGELFEVVACDPDEATIEIQFYDGTVEEYDEESWEEMGIIHAEPPEDWSGSLDVSGEDYGVDLDRPAGDLHINPLDAVEDD
ncbi:MAG TPA: hypothetical protein EYH03_00615 [Chromatiales bacterium]|nr:hypothetical protein [Chromatiales bacterium]